MTHKYNVHKDFRLLSLYTAPSGSIIYKLGNAVLNLLPKDMRSNGPLNIYKAGNKYIITPNAPGNAKLPCCLFIHGGGFNFKAAPYHYRLTQEYALSTGTVTIMIDYRLAYNSSYGTPLQDCVDAWEWMCSHEKELGIDINRSTIIGDSAGGFLAIKTAMSSAIKPDKLMLVYPVIDCNMTSISMNTLDKTPVWNSSLNREMWRSYFKDKKENSLLDMAGSELEGISGCYIETAEFDCLRDEGIAFARKLEDLGINVCLHQTKGTIHGFDIMNKSEITREQIRKRTEWLKYP